MSVRAAITAGSLKRGVLLLVASLLFGLAATASPALAVQTHVFRSTVGAGELTAPAGLAVDSAGGDLYVADSGSSTLFRFDAAGAPEPFTSTGTDELGPFTFPEGSQQVAVDNSATSGDAGDFYVLDGTSVKAFDAAGEPAPFTAAAGYLSGNEITGSTVGNFLAVGSVAVDTRGDIYVSDPFESVIRVFAPSGEYLTSIEGVTFPFLGVPDSSGVTYAGNSEIGQVEAFVPSRYPVTAGTYYTNARLSFIPGAALAVETDGDQVFSSNSTSPRRPTSITQYGRFAGGNSFVSTFGAEQLTGGVTGIAAAGTDGPVAGDVYAATGAQVDRFGPITVPGVVSGTATAIEPASGSATLNGTVDPDGIALTECEFEYGPTVAYGQKVECEGGPGAVGTGTLPKPVAARLTGLAPGVYHFRLVAANANGAAEPGADRIFDTAAAPAVGNCPNEALRVGPSALLPECRAYEMVSPVDKNGGGVFPAYNNLTTSNGDAAEFLSTSSFAGAPANNLNAYIARRGQDGWETSAIDAPQTVPSRQVEITTPGTSPDFTRSFQASLRALVPGATEGGSNLYLRDNLTGAQTLIATESSRVLFEEFANGTPQVILGNEDWSDVFFGSARALTPGAVQGERNQYEFKNGVLLLVTAPGGAGEPPTQAEVFKVTPSTDRVFFQARPSGALYVREGNAQPVPITASQRAVDRGTLGPAESYAVTPDGSVVFFNSGSKLTESSESMLSTGLYRYEVGSGKLEDLTPTGDPQVRKVLGVAADGSRAFVLAGGALAPGSTQAPELAANIFSWQSGGFHLIAQTDPATSEGTGLYRSAQSPNGDYFAIETLSPLNSETATDRADCPRDGTIGNPPGDCLNVFLYDAGAERLTCVSCGAPLAGNSTLGNLDTAQRLQGESVRAVLDDGEVFFDTPNALVPRDTNGVRDVYGWREGRAILISTGTDPRESRFSDASPDGRDVFFRTTQALVGQDIDSNFDLYDARVEGGIASQNPPTAATPCEGDACKGSATSAPPPLKSSVGATPATCRAISARATKAKNGANRLARQARKATGRHAKALRRRAATERRRAKKLSKKTTQCRRQGK